MKRRPSSATALFRRYVSTRDGSVFEQFFELTAPALMRFALRARSARAEAEDLVQETFLTAIQKAHLFDARKDVLAWLLGILLNHARMAQRRASRFVQRELFAASAAESPEEAARVAELNRSLSAAVRGLDPPYREVVRLHVEEGLTPAAVAEQLETSPSTVRTQLSRGLAQLRARLPNGFTLAALGLPGLEPRLAAQRRRLAERAGRRAEVDDPSTAAEPVAAGHRASRMLALLGPISLLVIFGLGAGGGGSASPPGASPLPDRQPRGEDPRPAANALQQPMARKRLQPVDRDATVTTTHRVRLVAGRGREPLPDVPLRLLLDYARGRTTTYYYDRDLIRNATTDANGIATFTEAPHGTPVAVSFDDGARLSRPSVVDGVTLHEVVVTNVLRLSGRVLDEGGEPVGGARLHVSSNLIAMPGFVAAVSGPEGRYTATLVGFRNTLFAWVEAEGFEPSRLRGYRAVEGTTSAVFRLRRSTLSLRVNVEDAAGAPVPGCQVRLAYTGEGWRFRPVRTETSDASGTCRFPGLWRGPYVVSVRKAGFSPASRALETAGTDRVLDVVVASGAHVSGVVTDRTGAPLTGALVVVRPRSVPTSRLTASIRSTRTDAEGAFDLEHTVTGDVLFLLLEGTAIVHSERLRLGEAEHLTLRPVVAADRAIGGRVVDASGSGVSGLRLTAVPVEFPFPRGKMPRAVTDEEGTFRLAGLRASYYRIVLDGRDGSSRPVPSALATIPNGVLDAVVRWSPGREGRIVGRLLDPSGRSLPQTLLLVRPSGFEDSLEYRSDEEGGFAIGQLSAGTYEISVDAGRLGRHWICRERLEHGQVLDLGAVRLPPPGRARVSFDPGEGASTDWLRCTLRDEHGHEFTLGRVEQLVHLTRPLAPGTWSLSCDGPGCAPARLDFEVVARETVPVRVPLRAAPVCHLVLEIDQARNPSPRAELAIDVRDGAGRSVVRHRSSTASDEYTMRFGLRPGTYSVSITTDFEATGHAVVEIGEVGRSVRVTVE